MQQHDDDMNDSIRRHPSSLAPPERHRRFGPWGIFAVIASVVVLLTGVLLVVSMSGGNEPPPPGAVGAAAPEFDLASIDGSGHVQLSQFRGRVVVVAFERAHCRACRASEAVLDETWQKYRHLGVSVVGIRRGVPVSANAGSKPGAWPVLADPRGETAIAYGVHAELETFVIDEDGIVVAGLAGPVTAGVLVAQLALVLGDGTSPFPLESAAAEASRDDPPETDSA
jgi:cytochrome c biogenesis protein CcmG/thiol:disulfide interchange protein DsbE